MDIAAHLCNTQLADRLLWFDGDSSFDSRNIQASVQRFDIKYVTSITPDVAEYNKHVPKSQALTTKQSCRPLSFDWALPEDAKSLDIVQYLFDKHMATYGDSTPDAIDREQRLSEELVKYRQRGHFDVLRTMIFIINKLTSQNVVWGVGRGSSVSSYVLYLIGVHDVDSFAYGLDIDDFLHE